MRDGSMARVRVVVRVHWMFGRLRVGLLECWFACAVGTRSFCALARLRFGSRACWLLSLLDCLCVGLACVVALVHVVFPACWPARVLVSVQVGLLVC